MKPLTPAIVNEERHDMVAAPDTALLPLAIGQAKKNTTAPELPPNVLLGLTAMKPLTPAIVNEERHDMVAAPDTALLPLAIGRAKANTKAPELPPLV